MQEIKTSPVIGCRALCECIPTSLCPITLHSVPFVRLQRAFVSEKMAQLVPFFPRHPSLWWEAAILPPAFAHITVLGLKVDNLVLSEFQAIIFKQCPHEPNTWTAPCPYSIWGRTPDESDDPITHWDLNRTRKWWDWTCVVSLENLELPLLNI